MIDFITAASLSSPNIKHGFFGRKGGVSTGEYTSLNVGLGSGDDLGNVAEESPAHRPNT